MRCGKSHDLDLILDAEEKERDSKKRRKQKHEPSTLQAQTPLKPETAVTPETAVESSEVTVIADSRNTITAPATSGTTDIATAASTTQSQSTTAPKHSQPGSSSAPTVAEPGTNKEAMNVVQPGEKFHSAYYDAFMTGTIFLHQLHHHEVEMVEAQAKNKIYLIGKSFPLIVEKSNFTKYSPSHERQRAQ